MKKRIPGVVLLLAALPLVCQPFGRVESRSEMFGWADASAADKSLFAQSAAQLLDRQSASGEVSYLLFDARTGALLASRWNEMEKPIPLGSLVKPFTAVAYAEAHQFHYPIHFCRGAIGGCWLPRGHGQVDIASAIANSCNSYFRMLTAQMNGESMDETARRFGLDEPAPGLPGTVLAGVGKRWMISPLHMAQAYLELNRRRGQAGVREVLTGMARSARQGTAAELGRAFKQADALVKTGTAACTHQGRAPGDGFAVALVPADQPALLLMVRVHGVPGSRAAATAGRMLALLREQTSGVN